jgi:hypothetical protein
VQSILLPHLSSAKMPTRKKAIICISSLATFTADKLFRSPRANKQTNKQTSARTSARRAAARFK